MKLHHNDMTGKEENERTEKKRNGAEWNEMGCSQKRNKVE
jgi:hypothetical protein